MGITRNLVRENLRWKVFLPIIRKREIVLRSKGSLGESGETTHGFLGWVFAICIVYYIGMWVFDSIQETKHERIEKQRDWKAVGKF